MNNSSPDWVDQLGAAICMTQANVAVSSGILNITGKQQSITCPASGGSTAFSYTGGVVAWNAFSVGGTSSDTIDIKVRMQFTGGQGPWDAIWMLGTNCQYQYSAQLTSSGNGCPAFDTTGYEEIDIAERPMSSLTNMNQQVHMPTGDPGCMPAITNMTTAFHIYEVVWVPGTSVTWKVDGTTTCTDSTAAQVPSQPMYFLIDQILGGYGGSITNGDLPQTDQIDYVRVTKNATLVFDDEFDDTTLGIGQPDQVNVTSSLTQIWPGCSSQCLPANPAYVMLPGSSRRVWTNICTGTNSWGGAGYPSEVPSCTYPASVATTWTVNSGNCTMSPSPSTAFSTLSCPGSIAATELDTITATSVQDTNVSQTFHVLVTVPAHDTLGNSASMALHYCGTGNPATCTYVAPFYEVLYKGQYADVQAYVAGKVNTAVTWNVSPGTGLTVLNGTSNRDIAVQAVTAGTYTLTATSVADGTSTAAATIVVTANNLSGQTRTSKVTPIDCTPEGSGTTYNVTDDTSFGAVPWNTLTAGDTVTIHAKAALATYAIPFQIITSGTATQPIRVCGIPDGSGNLPILTGNLAGQGNVTVAQQPFGMVVLVSSTGQGNQCTSGAGCSQPPEPDTHSVIIEGLKILSAYSAYSRSGGAAAWQQGAACIRVEARDIVLRGNDCSDSSDGFFIGSTTTLAESRVTRRLAVEGNTMYGNGENSSSSFHNNYLQGEMLNFQWNWVGQVGHGGQGSSVKTRMGYSVIRYNYIQGSSRTIDMVEVQDWVDLAIPTSFYFDNYGGTNTGIADIASVVQNVQTEYVYGNVLDDNSTLPGGAPGNPIHYFCDVFGNAEQGGIAYVYGNTQREIHDGTGMYADNVFIWDSTTGQCGVPQVWPRWQLTNNVVDIECATAGCGNGQGWFSPTVAYQDRLAFDKNWLTTGWDATATGSGPATYWTGCCSDPTDNGNSCYQTTCTSASGTNNITGETNIVTGATVPFNSTTFIPPSGSPLLNAAISLPSGASDMPPEFNYEPDNQAISIRADLSANLPSTLGALAGVGAPSAQGIHFGMLP